MAVDYNGNYDNYIFTQNGHVTSSIWNYNNVWQRPEGPLLININQNQWQATSAVCAIPAFIGRTYNIPILISDNTDDEGINIKYQPKSIINWGSDAKSATEQIALDYWTSTELAFSVNDYEHALWIIPSASFLSAPILVSPTQDTIDKLGIKCLISVVNSPLNIKTETIYTLETKYDVWSFQLELYESKGIRCNYVIVTNPNDTDDNLNANIKWPYLSIATAPLSAFRRALVQTGDYTAVKETLEEFNKAQGRIDIVYAEAQPYFRKV
jgi:hypothetical protein